MTANEAIEVIKNAQNYSEEEYDEAFLSVEEFYSESDKMGALRSMLLRYYNRMDQYDTFDAKTCRRILKTLFEEDK